MSGEEWERDDHVPTARRRKQAAADVEREREEAERTAAIVEAARQAGTLRQRDRSVTTRFVDPATLRMSEKRKQLCANPACDVSFAPRSPNQRYHDASCREAAERKRESEREEPPVARKDNPNDGELRARYLRLLLQLDDDGRSGIAPRVERILKPLDASELVELAELEPHPIVLDHAEAALYGERPAG